MRYKLIPIVWQLCSILALCLPIPFFALAASPVDITLAWDANQEHNLAGYKIYYKIGEPVLENDPQATAQESCRKNLKNYILSFRMHWV